MSGRLAAAVSELQAVDAEEGATSEQLAGVEGRLGALLAKRQAALYDVELQLALEAGQVEALVGGRGGAGREAVAIRTVTAVCWRGACRMSHHLCPDGSKEIPIAAVAHTS